MIIYKFLSLAATFWGLKISGKLREVWGYSGKSLVTQGRFFYSKSGNPVCIKKSKLILNFSIEHKNIKTAKNVSKNVIKNKITI